VRPVSSVLSGWIHFLALSVGLIFFSFSECLGSLPSSQVLLDHRSKHPGTAVRDRETDSRARRAGWLLCRDPPQLFSLVDLASIPASLVLFFLLSARLFLLNVYFSLSIFLSAVAIGAASTISDCA
jgi:hypothetical protein